MRIGILTISDRAADGRYQDQGGPAIEAWLAARITSPWTPDRRIVPDGIEPVSAALIDLADRAGAGLILTTGGTGPAPRDLTPEALARVIDREMPGFGEAMRAASLKTVPTAILSRQTAGLRGSTLIVALPGKPAAIGVCLDAVFPAIPWCLELTGAGRIDAAGAFRPA
ncbi:molybdopterin adenylyltransferase (plasmid) [Tistrella mobilis]|uniref:Molybdopterin adenylyltransferase n=1 Tax=Tistrella mobilis TaxID=171437 RepID=A0A162L3W1_9PROT|nr:molybdopterin adenylyltransferase [Tistrella mobilis]KYO53163.1 molybdopterin adenylyltransferase [Tistrella mobilis]